EMQAMLAERGLRDLSFAVVAMYAPDRSLNGLSMREVALKRGASDSLDAQLDVAREMLLEGGASMVYHFMSDADVDRIMRHPQVSIASDASVIAYGDGAPHPRGYGNNARVLGTYVRARHVLSLEDAIRKMTSLPATHFKLSNRGTIRVGYAADLVVFDPGAVSDAATFEAPHAYATGLSYVFVNGVAVVKGGAQTDARPGQVIANSLMERRELLLRLCLALATHGHVPERESAHQDCNNPEHRSDLPCEGCAGQEQCPPLLSEKRSCAGVCGLDSGIRISEPSEAHGERQIHAPRGHQVVLSIAQRASGDRVAAIAEIAAVEAQPPPIPAVAPAHVDGRVRLGERRIALVEIPVAHVPHDRIADEARRLGQDHARREQM